MMLPFLLVMRLIFFNGRRSSLTSLHLTDFTWCPSCDHPCAPKPSSRWRVSLVVVLLLILVSSTLRRRSSAAAFTAAPT